MTPTQVAVTAAAATAIVLALIPVDQDQEHQLRVWLPRQARVRRVAVAALQMVGTAAVIAGASLVGWTPKNDAPAITAISQGIAWAGSAVLALRAEFVGFRAGEMTPGFTILRSASDAMTAASTARLRSAVLASLPTEAGALYSTARTVAAHAFPLRVEDGSPSGGLILAQATIGTQHQIGDTDLLAQYVTDLVITRHVERCWS